MFQLNTIEENQIYFVLLHTFESFPFVSSLLCYLALLIKPSFFFVHLELFVCTSFFFRRAALTKSLGGVNRISDPTAVA